MRFAAAGVIKCYWRIRRLRVVGLSRGVSKNLRLQTAVRGLVFAPAVELKPGCPRHKLRLSNYRTEAGVAALQDRMPLPHPTGERQLLETAIDTAPYLARGVSLAKHFVIKRYYWHRRMPPAAAEKLRPHDG